MIRRLSTPDDVDLAIRTFALMAEVFEEPGPPLGAPYVATLLSDPTFWAYAAIDGTDVVAGLTAHTLPMTRNETREVFIYDIAVHDRHRRRGLGRGLIEALREAALAEGIEVVFVPVDDDDDEAIDFYRSLQPVESPVRFFVWE